MIPLDVIGNEVGEKCGLAGVFYNDPDTSLRASFTTYLLMEFEQNRGRDGAGIVAYDHKYKNFRTRYGKGKVEFAFNDLNEEEGWDDFTGRSAIGHIQYSTVQNLGLPKSQDLQPIISKSGEFCLGHNGTIEPRSLGKLIQSYGPITTDSEGIVALLDDLYGRLGDWGSTLKEASKTLDGSYTCEILTKDGKILFMREPRGLKPAHYSKIYRKGEFVGYAIASETTPLRSVVHTSNILSLDPGSYLIIDEEGAKVENFAKPITHAHCAFEFVYFQNPSSNFEGKNIDLVRLELGKILAKKDKGKLKADSVGPIPKSGWSAARGYSEESGLVLREYLKENEVGRSFIQAPGKRMNTLKLKYSIIEPHVVDKEIVIVDDSIVRSTTMQELVKWFKEYGAKGVHLRISYPTIKFPCLHGGIAFSKPEELGMNRYGDEEGLKEVIGADSLVFTTIDDLKKAIGLNDICTACINGIYPLKDGEVTFEKMKENLYNLQEIYVSG